MRTFKPFSNPEIFISGAIEPDNKSHHSKLEDFEGDLKDFCRIINFIRQDKRWITVVNPSPLLKLMLSKIDLGTKQIMLVYSNNKSSSFDIACRALACGHCGAVIARLDNISTEQYIKLENASVSGNSIAYIIGIYNSLPQTNSLAQTFKTTGLMSSNELSFDDCPIDNMIINCASKNSTVIDFKKKREELQSSFEF